MTFIKSILSFFTKGNEQPQNQNTIYYDNKSTSDTSNWSKFYIDNLEYINPLKEKLLYFSMKANETITDIDTTISDCKETIKLFNDLKDYCYKTQEGIIYFEYMWEPRNPHSHIETAKKRLQDLTENYAERKRYYERRQYAMKHLKNDVITLISNNENILQKDVYSHFDVDLKDSIARLLNNMDRKGEIKRVKHGSTYQLSIK